VVSIVPRFRLFPPAVKTISVLFASSPSTSRLRFDFERRRRVRHKLAALDEPHLPVSGRSARDLRRGQAGVIINGFAVTRGPAQGQLEAISGCSAGSSLKHAPDRADGSLRIDLEEAQR